MSFSERRLVRESAFDITSKLFRISWLYVLLLTMLAAVGYAALYSAAGGSPEPYAGRHMLRFGFGLVMMLCIAMIDIRFIQRMSWVAWVGGVVLLILVLKVGNVGKGAQRWIDLGPVQLQPSELMKIMLALGLAVVAAVPGLWRQGCRSPGWWWGGVAAAPCRLRRRRGTKATDFGSV